MWVGLDMQDYSKTASVLLTFFFRGVFLGFLITMYV